MKKIALTIILLCPAIGISCEIPLGLYEQMTESEFSVKIKLEPKGKLIVIHENWIPGQKDKSVDKYVYDGSWECHEKVIKVKYSKYEASGTYMVTTLPYLPEITSDTLVFDSNENNKNLISGSIFWPSSYLKESFND